MQIGFYTIHNKPSNSATKLEEMKWQYITPLKKKVDNIILFLGLGSEVTMNKKSSFFLSFFQSMWLLNVLRGAFGNNNAKGVGPWLPNEIDEFVGGKLSKFNSMIECLQIIRYG